MIYSPRLEDKLNAAFFFWESSIKVIGAERVRLAFKNVKTGYSQKIIFTYITLSKYGTDCKNCHY